MTFAQIAGLVCGICTFIGVTALWDLSFSVEVAKKHLGDVFCLTIFAFVIGIFIGTTIYRNLQ